MVQQNYLRSLIGFVDKDIPWVRVTVHIALDKYHLTVQPP